MQSFLIFFLAFFLLFYIIENRDTIPERIEVIREGSKFFAKSAGYNLVSNEENVSFVDKKTDNIELEVFKQINDVREQAGLQRLKWDPKLHEVALFHSRDMAENSYLNHTNLEGQGPNERAEDLGVNLVVETDFKIYTGVGENIGFMPKGVVSDVGVLLTGEDIASAAVYKWLDSLPHKENILGEYFYTGIGVAYDSNENYYLTQVFQ